MESSLSSVLIGLGQVAVVAALAFAVYCMLVSHMRFQMLARKAAGAIAKPESAGTAFPVLVAEWLAMPRPEGCVVGLILAAPRDYERSVAESRSALADEMSRFVAEQLRARARRNDRVLPVGPGETAVLLFAPARRIGTIARRLAAEFVELTLPVPGGSDIEVPIHVGWSVEEHEKMTAAELIARARSALANPAGLIASPDDASATHHDAGEAADNPALLDVLTGVLKPAQVPGAVQKYVALYRREDLPIAVLHVDVDYLKRYNTQYGRDTGDRILKRLSDFLQRNTREADLIGRLGDDEFLVALSATGPQALAVARRLILRGKRSDALSIGDGLRFTISIGVAAHPEQGSVSASLCEAARLALHAVKARGRNNCALPDGTVASPSSRGRKRTQEERDVL